MISYHKHLARALSRNINFMVLPNGITQRDIVYSSEDNKLANGVSFINSVVITIIKRFKYKRFRYLYLYILI